MLLHFCKGGPRPQNNVQSFLNTTTKGVSKTQKEGWRGGYQIRSNCESGHQASNLQPFGPQPSNLSLHQELLGKPSRRQNIFQGVQALHLSLQFSHNCRLLLLTLLANGLSGHNSNLFKCYLPTPTWLCRLEVESLSSQICEQSCWLESPDNYGCWIGSETVSSS